MRGVHALQEGSLLYGCHRLRVIFHDMLPAAWQSRVQEFGCSFNRSERNCPTIHEESASQPTACLREVEKMRRFLPFFISIFALSLAACGGGGGSTGGGGTLTPPVHTNTVSLHGGFNGGPSTFSQGRRAAQSALPMDVNLTALPPTGLFDVPDPYINGNPDGIKAETMYAYLTTSDGTMNGIPSPLPTPSLTQTGPAMSVTSIVPAANPLPTSPPVLIGGFNMLPPESDGHTVATISTTVNGTPMSANLDVFTYSGACVSSPQDKMTYNCAPGLYWDAAGLEHVTSDTSQADVYITDNGDGTNSLTFPAGAAELPSTVAYKVTSVPSVPSGPSAFDGKYFNSEINAGHYPFTFVFRTRSGIYVKWGIVAGYSDPNAGLASGSLWNVYGDYLATTGSTFAY